jgi:ribonuclease HII
MQNYDAAYAGYAFGRHKGYGTQAHRLAIQELGVCEIHRKSFKPIRSHVELTLKGLSAS